MGDMETFRRIYELEQKLQDEHMIVRTYDLGLNTASNDVHRYNGAVAARDRVRDELYKELDSLSTDQLSAYGAWRFTQNQID